jgi:hypothetical protein
MPIKDHELDLLEPRSRVAVVSACVEHVLDVYRWGNHKLQVRHAPGAAPNKRPGDDLIDHALELAWAFAETGKQDAAEIAALDAGIRKPPPEFDPEDIGLPSATFVDAVAKLVQAMTDETPAAASRAARDSRYALVSALQTVVDDEQELKRAEQDEAVWQVNVLHRVQAMATAPTRKDLADLLAQALPWRRHMDEYRDYYR